MIVIRLLFELCSAIAAALAGNWVGGQLRSRVTGQSVQSIRFNYVNAQGQTISNVPVITKFYPAVLTACLGKPRWLYAFLGGVVTGGLIDDRYELFLWRRLGERLILKKNKSKGCAETGCP